MAQKIPRNNRAVDEAPCGNHLCRHVVRRPNIATGHAFETISVWSVSFVHTSAGRTGVGRSPRIHDDYWNPSECRLVFDEAPQLPESPRAVAATLRLSNRCLGSDALQIFQGNHAPSAFGFHHQVLGNAVVDILSISLLPPHKSLEMSLSALGSPSLEFRFQFLTFAHDAIYSLAFVRSAIRIHGEVDDSQVNSENSNRVVWSWFRSFNYDSEIEYTFSEQKVGLPANPVHTGFLVVADADWNFDSPVEGQDGSLFETLPREDALVINHGPLSLNFGMIDLSRL